MQILLEQARDMARKDENLSKRYVELARKISMRTKIRIPREEKRYLCKGCGIALIPGLNARVRLSPKNIRVVITCLSCGTVKRYPFVRLKRKVDGSSVMKPYITPSSVSPKKKFRL